MEKGEYYKSLFTGGLVGKTIKKIHFNDDEKRSNINDYPISALEFEDGTSICFQGSPQVDDDTVWASLEEK